MIRAPPAAHANAGGLALGHRLDRGALADHDVPVLDRPVDRLEVVDVLHLADVPAIGGEALGHVLDDAIGAAGHRRPDRSLADLARHFGFSIRRVRDLPSSTRSVTDLRDRTIVGAGGDIEIGAVLGSDAASGTGSNRQEILNSHIDNYQPSLALNFLVATEGIYPGGSLRLPVHRRSDRLRGPA